MNEYKQEFDFLKQSELFRESRKAPDLFYLKFIEWLCDKFQNRMSSFFSEIYGYSCNVINSVIKTTKIYSDKYEHILVISLEGNTQIEIFYEDLADYIEEDPDYIIALNIDIFNYQDNKTLAMRYGTSEEIIYLFWELRSLNDNNEEQLFKHIKNRINFISINSFFQHFICSMINPHLISIFNMGTEISAIAVDIVNISDYKKIVEFIDIIHAQTKIIEGIFDICYSGNIYLNIFNHNSNLYQSMMRIGCEIEYCLIIINIFLHQFVKSLSKTQNQYLLDYQWQEKINYTNLESLHHYKEYFEYEGFSLLNHIKIEYIYVYEGSLTRKFQLFFFPDKIKGITFKVENEFINLNAQKYHRFSYKYDLNDFIDFIDVEFDMEDNRFIEGKINIHINNNSTMDSIIKTLVDEIVEYFNIKVNNASNLP